MNTLILLIFVLVMVAVLGLVVAMAIYVAKDAKGHDMNPILWVLVVIFVPNFLGLVIYLIVRSSAQKRSTCYQCGKQVENDFAICPYCQAELTMHCRACTKVLSPEWHSCPNCGQEVDADQVTIVPKRDKGLKMIILLVVIVPVILFVLVLLSMVSFRTITSTGGHTVEMMAVENNFGREFEYSAKAFSGEKADPLTVKQEGIIKLTSSIYYETGELNAGLYNEGDEMLYEFVLNGEDTLEMTVAEGERYFIKIKGKSVKDIKAHFNWDYIME